MGGLIGWKMTEIEECKDTLKLKEQTSFRLVQIVVLYHLLSIVYKMLYERMGQVL